MLCVCVLQAGLQGPHRLTLKITAPPASFWGSFWMKCSQTGSESISGEIRNKKNHNQHFPAYWSKVNHDVQGSSLWRGFSGEVSTNRPNCLVAQHLDLMTPSPVSFNHWPPTNPPAWVIQKTVLCSQTFVKRQQSTAGRFQSLQNADKNNSVCCKHHAATPIKLEHVTWPGTRL